jgi:DNA-binding NarL/FixJ family response regulator
MNRTESLRVPEPNACPVANFQGGVMIRVFLVCDDLAFCEKLRNFFDLQDDFQVCGKAARNLAATHKADKLLPDVAIIVAHGVPDFKVLDDFKKSIPHLPLFFMTTTPSVEIEKKALSHGVDAVFAMDDDFTTLALNAREVCPEKHIVNDVSTCVGTVANIRVS